MGGHPGDLSAHEEGKGPVWKIRSPLGEGKSQRCSRFKAPQEVPLGKGHDRILFREVAAQEIGFAERALTLVKHRE